eukprot:3933593-Rhodomonas_salina.1
MPPDRGVPKLCNVLLGSLGITYALCYGYARCTKSIGCVTPIYYADKIAGSTSDRRFAMPGPDRGCAATRACAHVLPSRR